MECHGTCACGRNTYVIEIPNASSQLAQVYLDNSSSNRRHLAAPITAWLRVPLSWFHSTTYAFFPDETHRTIRRTFVSPFDESTRRQFCGYCGTQISQWRENGQGDADFIHLTLGSLIDEDLDRLRQHGILEFEGESEEEDEETTVQAMDMEKHRPVQGSLHRGAPWYEELVEKTPLGRIKRQKGGHMTTSNDGTVEQVEWEITEWNEEDDDNAPMPPKRKIGEVEEADVEMRA
ncbi:hypothetical protein E2P81_ATG01473 [Venturia nashicola]|uniref:CENP-V/GFA domain-containing protein n=1 Tax=Venturia nashicola TaxID=86259 RepID=A0A4Z1PLX1_9PEZI|nr:hypothetical protein E6O75_ATG01509 [Venturia nashicola]TLD38930.1 hypothetical protein E2P81_ATG01473 [Venturia nashicola]